MRRKFSGFGRAAGIGLVAFLVLTLALGMLGYGGDSLAQVTPSESGNPNQKTASGPKEFKHTVVTSQKSDGAEASPAAPPVKAGAPAPGGDVGAVPSKEAAVYSPLWQRLAGLSQADRENALIQVEADSRCSSSHLGLLKNAEALWNRGKFEAALDSFRSLESAGVRFALGVSWKRPKAAKPASEVSFGEGARFLPSSNVRIGTRWHIQKTELDFDAQNGNLFAVLKYHSDNEFFRYWSVNISIDEGRSWQETYEWSAVYEIKDVSAVVVGDYLYVAYVAVSRDEARLRRFLVSNGSVDSSFTSVVFDKNIPINEVCLVSNADDLDNRLYYLAILSSGQLVYYWAYDVNTATPVWTEVATGVTNAGTGLAATWNKNFPSGYFLYASYIASDGNKPVMVLRYNETTWEAIQVLSHYTGYYYATSISAYNDTVICAFEHTYDTTYACGNGIRYQISYNGGGAWNDGNFPQPPPPWHRYSFPDVTARGGQGTALIFRDEPLEFNPVWFLFRAGYQPGGWEAPVQINQFYAKNAYMNRIQWLSGGAASYGAIYIRDDPTGAYFTRMNTPAAMPWLMLLLE